MVIQSTYLTCILRFSMYFTTIYACRKIKGLSSKISACTPSFCTVYAVSKGKLSSIRPSDSETVVSSKDDNSDTCSTVSTSSNASSLQTGNVNYLHYGLSCIFLLDYGYDVVLAHYVSGCDHCTLPDITYYHVNFINFNLSQSTKFMKFFTNKKI